MSVAPIGTPLLMQFDEVASVKPKTPAPKLSLPSLAEEENEHQSLLDAPPASQSKTKPMTPIRGDGKKKLQTPQSAQIQGVSGATYTSNGYEQSLQAALDQAHSS